MKPIKFADLAAAANQLGLVMVTEQSGYRVAEDAGSSHRELFPGSDLPAQSKRACLGFLVGFKVGRARGFDLAKA